MKNVISRSDHGVRVIDTDPKVDCPCLEGRSRFPGRARHFFRQEDGTIRPACMMCSDSSQLHFAQKFDEDTVDEYICQEIMES